MDFEFTKLSAALGKFLSTCYEDYPDVKIEDVSKFYPYSGESIRVSVSVPETLAVILKLTFSQELRDRPIPKKKDIDFKKFYIDALATKVVKNNTNKYIYFDSESSYDKMWYDELYKDDMKIVDYIDILKDCK